MAGNAEKRKNFALIYFKTVSNNSHKREENRIYYACLFGYYPELIFILFNPIP